MSVTDGTGDYGEDEGQDTWQPADTKLELQMKALEQGRTMSAFDDWWKTYQVDEESDSTGVIPKDAFNAGLEAAAKQCLHHYLAKDALEAIRELKEES